MLECAGLPEDARLVLADLYSNVSTSVRVPAGLSPAVAIERGVIQGDCLSPVVFNIFLDGVLRWLDQGDCGYTPSSLAYKIAVTGFADDFVGVDQCRKKTRGGARNDSGYRGILSYLIPFFGRVI
jgi:hypothetical protein